MKKFLLFLMIAFVYVIHQDNWNWNKNRRCTGASCPSGWRIMPFLFHPRRGDDGVAGQVCLAETA